MINQNEFPPNTDYARSDIESRLSRIRAGKDISPEQYLETFIKLGSYNPEEGGSRYPRVEPGPYEDRAFEVRLSDDGKAVYVFTPDWESITPEELFDNIQWVRRNVEEFEAWDIVDDTFEIEVQ